MTKARDIASQSTIPTAVSSTELGYVDGVTSAIQTQIDGKSGTAHAHTGTYEPVLPSQTGNSGKYLTTDGTNKSWGTLVSGSAFTPMAEGQTSSASVTITKSFPAGNYEVKSSAPIILTLGSTSVSTVGNYTPTMIATTTSNTSATLTNGSIAWTSRTLPASTDWMGVAYGNNIFVATGVGTNAASSTDGYTWTARTMPSSQANGWSWVNWCNDKFITQATLTTYAAYSTNGTTWTASTLPNSTYWSGPVYGGGTYVMMGTGWQQYHATSSDGITWTLRSANGMVRPCRPAYGGGVFATVDTTGSNTNGWSSTDGISWTSRAIGTNMTAITYGNGKFVAVSNNNTSAAYSSNGTSWTVVSIPGSPTNWQDVVWNGTKFIAIPVSGTSYASSTDGITWTVSTGFVSATWSAVAASSSTTVAVSQGTSNVAASSGAASVNFGIYSSPTTTY
jgi:hypothetical protein